MAAHTRNVNLIHGKLLMMMVTMIALYEKWGVAALGWSLKGGMRVSVVAARVGELEWCADGCELLERGILECIWLVGSGNIKVLRNMRMMGTTALVMDDGMGVKSLILGGGEERLCSGGSSRHVCAGASYGWVT